jgi:hypothetical protein
VLTCVVILLLARASLRYERTGPAVACARQRTPGHRCIARTTGVRNPFPNPLSVVDDGTRTVRTGLPPRSLHHGRERARTLPGVPP